MPCTAVCWNEPHNGCSQRLPKQGVVQQWNRISDISFCLLVLLIKKKKKRSLFSKLDQASLLVTREAGKGLALLL